MTADNITREDGRITAIDMRPVGLPAGYRTVEVTFGWSPEYGWCGECGLPAAYVLDGVSRRPDNAPDESDLRCSVCAAMAASEGQPIRYLFAEDEA